MNTTSPTTSPTASPPPSLRERNKRRTRRDIEDAATRLVEKHGFEHVTIEDICADAGISRRTFFNYMPTKDDAVLGSSGLELSPTDIENFIATPCANVVQRALEIIALSLAEEEDEFSALLHERRRAIIAAEPTLALAKINRFRTQAQVMHSHVLAHFEACPQDRKATDLSAAEEATIVSGLIRESVWLHVSTKRPLNECGKLIHTYAKELTW